LTISAIGAFSLAISYVVPVAATLAATGDPISILRPVSTPLIDFPPL
jgi:hypothetical protein